MNEATGQAGLMNIMLTVIGIIILLLAGSISYSKAFRVKNKIIDIIEKNKGYNDSSRKEITTTLNNIGYRTALSEDYIRNCPSTNGTGVLDNTVTPSHLYCVYIKYGDNSKTNYYYKVVAYMYFDLPIIGSYIKIPVSGETKVFYPEDDWKTVE